MSIRLYSKSENIIMLYRCCVNQYLVYSKYTVKIIETSYKNIIVTISKIVLGKK